ncbi:MAG TPA: hypothetical protein VJK51_04450 [Candidatus Nanoarchaeia archaeon]|nr:hypothetical protein [Candidatus Nanoarchaeia archaeon]
MAKTDRIRENALDALEKVRVKGNPLEGIYTPLNDVEAQATGDVRVYNDSIKRLEDQRREALESYVQQNGQRTYEPLSNESKEFKFFIGPRDNQIELKVTYSGLPKKGFFGSILGKSDSEQPQLKAELKTNEGVSTLPTLTIQYNGREIENRQDIALYINNLVTEAVINLSRKTEISVASLGMLPWYESDLVCKIATTLGDPNLKQEYVALIGRETTTRKLTREMDIFIEEGKQAKGELTDKLDKLKEKIQGDLEKKLLERADQGKSEIDLRKEEASRQIKALVEKAERDLIVYKSKKEGEINFQVVSEAREKKKGLEKEIDLLESDRKRRIAEIEKRKGNLDGAQVKIYQALTEFFPDYDHKEGNTKDVTPSVRARYTQVLADLVKSERNQLTLDELLTVIKDLRPKLIIPNKRKGYVEPEVGKVIDQIRHIALRVDASNFNNLLELLNGFGNEGISLEELEKVVKTFVQDAK